MIRLTCNDLGFACDHELQGENEAELRRAAEQHAVDVHGRKLEAQEVEQLRATLRAQAGTQ